MATRQRLLIKTNYMCYTNQYFFLSRSLLLLHVAPLIKVFLNVTRKERIPFRLAHETS